MANHLTDLLSAWHPHRDSLQWVLGTVYKTEGSCYRKAGAMMLFNSLGQQFGLLSGGCLESDIQLHARRIMADNKTRLLCYDANDEDDLSFQLGIGCGGTVYIVLQPVNAANHYLSLAQVYSALQQRKAGDYYQRIHDHGQASAYFVPNNLSSRLGPNSQCKQAAVKSKMLQKTEQGQPQDWLVTPVNPVPHLLVIGGGVDAQPVIRIGAELGWEMTLWDPRPAHARREYFPLATTILDGHVKDLTPYVSEQAVSAAILMSHNVKIDAQALAALHATPLAYLALLGPVSRREKVLKTAKLSEADLKTPVSGPAGLDIGAELPESIALSILAECHARLMSEKAALTASKSDKNSAAA